VFENRVLRRTFGSKTDEVKGDWRRLHKEELHNLYSSPSIIRMANSRRMRWIGQVARMGRRRMHVGRPRRRWVDNNKLDLREMGWDSRDWINVTQDRNQCSALVNTVMKLAGKFLSSCTIGGFSRGAQLRE
jgi:hypothetical protein